MCGIFLLYNKTGNFSSEEIDNARKNFMLLSGRGPDDTVFIVEKNLIIGFHRLSINDISSNGMQPFSVGQSTRVICNGEIYNSNELRKSFLINYPFKSDSDCETLAALLYTKGIEKTLELINGVFAIAMISKDTITLIRDRIGVKPIFYTNTKKYFGVSSLAKGLEFEEFKLETSIEEILPGSILRYFKNTRTHVITQTLWSQVKIGPYNCTHPDDTLRRLITASVKRRMHADRPIGCFLSGGLDSSIIASILSKELFKQGKTLRTFSVGFTGSSDLKYAQEVAKFIGSEHHELILDIDEALKRIPDIIESIESTCITSIRASTPMFLLCEWISKNFDNKVMFSGEGSDELLCGYRYFHFAPNDKEAEKESLRLVKELYKYDVLRADRCTSNNGLEFREPFLDQEVVDFSLSIPGSLKRPKDGIEKALLRQAFKDGYIPSDVLSRSKVAFSDGISNVENGEKIWFQHIKEYITKQYSMSEEQYYKFVFDQRFKSYNPCLKPWLPKWVASENNREPSAMAIVM